MTFARASGVVLGAGGLCVAYGVVIERRWFRLREISIRGGLRGGMPPAPTIPGTLRILHLSDLHLRDDTVEEVNFVRGLTRTRPDLVVTTGDHLGGAGVEDLAVDLLASLTADGTPGVAVLGSNDVHAPMFKSPLAYFTGEKRFGEPNLDTERLVRGLEAANYHVLDGERRVVVTRQGDVEVIGIGDPHVDETVLPAPFDVAVGHDAAIARLGLVHAPYTRALDLLVTAGADVLFAGHTHGGQVRFPPFGAVVGNCDLPLDQVRGLSRYRDRWLHVSPGLGTSRYAPFRFACRPEATLLVLTP